MSVELNPIITNANVSNGIALPNVSLPTVSKILSKIEASSDRLFDRKVHVLPDESKSKTHPRLCILWYNAESNEVVLSFANKEVGYMLPCCHISVDTGDISYLAPSEELVVFRRLEHFYRAKAAHILYQYVKSLGENL